MISACNNKSEKRTDNIFELLDSTYTNISFKNELEYEYSFNIYRYRNFYNGGGVALGDVNNDGLIDIYLTGNQISNRLYLNRGNFKFIDITEKADVAGNRAWSTGVSMADVNGDGWLDIYVCNSGIVEGDDKKNELYINNGDSTFTEMADQYGVDDPGLSIHASFFDYDRDGDLDLYLVNNSYRGIWSFDLQDNIRHTRHEAGGDRLYRNELKPNNPSDGERQKFTDVSEEAGIYGSEIGFGLGASVGDINRDGWPDMYVSNDFFERDYLYINNRDGTFNEVLEERIKSVSAAAMGADMADLNRDGYMEIFVTDMLPKGEERIKTVTSFDSWERYQNYIRDDYYHQFTRNTLQLNRGNVSLASALPGGQQASDKTVHFSEVSRLTGVEASDWSWGAMIADYDLDGNRDIFVANGIYQDLTNADYLVEIREENTKRKIISDNHVDFKKLIEMIPSNPIPNYMFAGSPELRFTDVSEAWGLAQPGFSNGSAYGDLDNDGDLDLVVNNVNMESFVYRNRATDMHPDRNWLQIELKGSPPNTFAVGSQLTAWAGGQQWYVEQQPVRGYQSSVDPVLHLGFGTLLPSARLDSLVIQWPDGQVTTRTNVKINQRLSIQHPAIGDKTGSTSIENPVSESQSAGTSHVSNSETQKQTYPQSPFLKELNPAALGLEWRHRENTYNDFVRQPLLFHMKSTEGPPICAGDINGDGRQDLFLGGAKDQPGAVFIQNEKGSFSYLEQPHLEDDRVSEDTDCVLFDADGDGGLDLYVASGGNELPASSSALMDRLYFNDGKGILNRSDQNLLSAATGFESTGVVTAADYDGDGDTDLFVGARLRPFTYGIPVDGHLLINEGNGNFTEATDELAPELRKLGLITDAQWADADGDGDSDLIIAGEWMPLTLFENQEGELINRTGEAGLNTSAGWWNAIALADLDNDGDLDLIGANHGLNSRFQASREEPVEIWINDFDQNGVLEQVVATYKNGKLYPMVLRHDLIEQIPSLEKKYPTYKSYAGQTIFDIFTDEQLKSAIHHRAIQLQSVVGWNDGNGHFQLEPLPQEAQLAPMYGILISELDSDGKPEILMGGNLYESKPEVGRYDASFGVSLTSDSTGFRSVPFSQSGFWVEGPTRNMATLQAGGRKLLIVTRNDATLKIFRYEN